jgi:hypothetical protein
MSVSETSKTESVNVDTPELGEAGECCLCGNVVLTLLNDQNADPVKPGGRCCGACDQEFVIPARARLAGART